LSPAYAAGIPRNDRQKMLELIYHRANMKLANFPIEETGLVLSVKNYEKCLRFYSGKLGLKIRFQKFHQQKSYLTVFDFGEGYLLIEKGRHSKSLREGVIRLNVRDVLKAVKAFRKRGLKIKFRSYDWGDIGNFKDPDGNPIEFCKWK
jgi:catechol 2,3-dioxygenase-like lactoylglutathione lyase family enzyme